MTRSKKTKAPLTRCNGTMTESQYLAWIRSALRSKSLKWPPRAEAIQRARRPYKGPNKLQKWEVQCAICNEWFKLKEIIVDHHPVAAGSILSVEDIGPFANNLYCEAENLRTLCATCHDAHSLAEARGITHEEAIVEKKILEICKQPTPKLLAFLAEHGYNGVAVSNSAKRRALVAKIIKGE